MSEHLCDREADDLQVLACPEKRLEIVKRGYLSLLAKRSWSISLTMHRFQVRIISTANLGGIESGDTMDFSDGASMPSSLHGFRKRKSNHL